MIKTMVMILAYVYALFNYNVTQCINDCCNQAYNSNVYTELEKLESTINNNDSINDLLTMQYDEQELIYGIPVSKQRERLPFECVRQNGSYIYVVYKINDDGYAFLFYDLTVPSSYPMVWRFNINRSFTQESFLGTIKKGMTSKEVKGYDKLGDYSTFYFSSDEVPRISNHYTNDGAMVSVFYQRQNNEHVVQSIESCNYESSVIYNILLPADRAFIQKYLA